MVPVMMTRRIKSWIWSFLALFVLCYFIYHGIHGERGLIRWYSLTQELQQVRQEQLQAHDQRLALENRVRLLRPESIDPDMLDERARFMLNYLKPNENMIMFSSPIPEDK